MCDCENGTFPEEEGSDALGFENELWASANKLRGKMDASSYKHIVLPLVFLKYISDSFEELHNELKSKNRNPELRDEYIAKGIFWVPEKARWSNIVRQATDPSIGIIIDDAMEVIERDNIELKGVLSKIFGNTDLPSRVLGELVTLFGNLPSFGTKDARSKDVIGRVYEYFIGKFAEAEKKGGGEFYTPRSVVRLLVEILQPYQGRIYDGCCGSGGMFVQSNKFMRAHSGKINVSVYGQEANPTTWRLAKMNLAIRRIEANLGEGPADTLLNDNFPDLRADFAIVNPPFNISDWGYKSLQNDARWTYGIPPKKNANYAWIQHYLHHLSPQGTAGIVMSNSALSSTTKEEKAIREAIINEDKVDCIIMLPDKLFSNTGISACIWILTNSKTNSKFRSRKSETLFIDCRNMGSMVTRKLRELSHQDICKIACTYQTWRSKDLHKNYQDVRGFCKSVTTDKEIKEQEYVLVPGRYVGAPPIQDDGEDYEVKMNRLVKELSEKFSNLKNIEAKIKENMEDFGFEF